MQTPELIQRAQEIVEISGIEAPPARDFLTLGQLAFYGARQLNARDREAMPWLREWAEGFRALYDNFEEIVRADPMMLYRPANDVAEAFHNSTAFIRYFMAGNRTSKTQSAYAEHYKCVTGNAFGTTNLYGRPAHATGIMAGLPFADYMPGVFEAKFISGEEGNNLSPMFPEGGKWFNYYDDKHHTLYLACPHCANTGRAGSCPHQKSTIRLFSPEKGYEAIQGQVFKLFHFDEDLVDEKPFAEARMRLKTAKGRLILSGTPLHGPNAWEQRLVYQPWLTMAPEDNRYVLEDTESPKLIEVFQISMRNAGLVPPEDVDVEARLMDEFEREARLEGKPIPIATNPVFDRKVLAELQGKYEELPRRGSLRVKVEKEGVQPQFNTVNPNTPIEFMEDITGAVRVWRDPKPGAIYLAVVDTAKGVSVQDPSGRRKGDYSCATVFEVTKMGMNIQLEQVAQFHGHINLLAYADPVFLLCVWYNSALCVVETTGGYGEAVVLKLKNEYAYWNLYRAPKTAEMVKAGLDARVGVETNASNKPFMVTCAQRMVNAGNVIPHGREDYGELAAYTKVDRSANGQPLKSPEYKGVGGSPDDRAITYIIASAIAVTSPALLELVAFVDQNAASAAPVSKDMAGLYKQLAEEHEDTRDF